MKSLLTILLILCAAGPAWAQYEPSVVHVLYENTSLPGIHAAEFAVDNLPFDQCTISEHWATDLVIGSVDYSVAMVFDPPLTGVLCYLGYLQLIVWEPLGNDYTMHVVPSAEGNLIVVDSDIFMEHTVTGGKHVFNCTQYCESWACDGQLGLWADEQAQECWQDAPPFTTPVEEGRYSTIKSLY